MYLSISSWSQSQLPFAVISRNMYSVRINRLHWKPSIIKSLTVLNTAVEIKVEMALHANKAVSKIQNAFRFSPSEGRHLCQQHVHRVAAEISTVNFFPALLCVVCCRCVLPVCYSMQKCSHVRLKKYECVGWDLLQTAMYLSRHSQLGLFVSFQQFMIAFTSQLKFCCRWSHMFWKFIAKVAINFVVVSFTPSFIHYACIYYHSLALPVIM